MLEVRVYSSPEQISVGFETAEFTGVTDTDLDESGFFMLLMEDGRQVLLLTISATPFVKLNPRKPNNVQQHHRTTTL